MNTRQRRAAYMRRYGDWVAEDTARGNREVWQCGAGARCDWQGLASQRDQGKCPECGAPVWPYKTALPRGQMFVSYQHAGKVLKIGDLEIEWVPAEAVADIGERLHDLWTKNKAGFGSSWIGWTYQMVYEPVNPPPIGGDAETCAEELGVVSCEICQLGERRACNLYEAWVASRALTR